MTVKSLVVSTLFAAALVAQPAIESAENAAGYMKAGLPNSGLAQGSLIVIKGTALGQTALAQASIPLPLSLAGTSATITAGGTTLTMPMNYVIGIPGNKIQISAVVPSNTPLGAATIRVTFNGSTSAPFGVNVVRSAFGIFSINSAGSGPAIVYTGARLNLPTESVNRSATVQIFGTGLGASAPADQGPAAAGDLPVDVEVWIGGKRATVAYRGRIPGIASIDQINFTVPADTPLGCNTSLIVKVSGVVSNVTTVPVAAGRTCVDPLGYPPEVLARAEANNGLAIGYIGLLKTATQISAAGVTIDNKTDVIVGAFQKYNYASVIGGASVEGSAATSVGSCNVYQFTGQNASVPTVAAPTGLDAGASLSATGPTGGAQIVEKIANQLGLYQKSVTSTGGIPGIPGLPTGGSEILGPGRYTVTGPGGANVGAFTASVTWPSAFAWSNQSSISTVNRNNDMTVTWTGGDSNGYVSITGFSIALNGTQYVGAGFNCLEQANVGRFVVPSIVLQALPVSTSLSGSPLGYLSVAASGLPNTFTATGLDYGYINYSSAITKTVTYQ